MAMMANWLKMQRENFNEGTGNPSKFWWEADVAKTDKSKCKKCRTPIAKDDPRLQFKSNYSCDGMGNTFGFFKPACAVYVGQKWGNYDAVVEAKIEGLKNLPPAGKAAIKAAISGGGSTG